MVVTEAAPPVAEAPVLVSECGTHAVVTLNRPQQHNALNSELLRLLWLTLRELRGAWSCIVITGPCPVITVSTRSIKLATPRSSVAGISTALAPLSL